MTHLRTQKAASSTTRSNNLEEEWTLDKSNIDQYVTSDHVDGVEFVTRPSSIHVPLRYCNYLMLSAH